MIALILAGGFAKRLWPLTKDTPKPLLDVGGRPIIEHVIRRVEKLDVDVIYVSTNAKFGPVFEEWLTGFESGKQIKLVVEPHAEEEKKFGAIGGIKFFMDKEDIKDDFLIIGGDNLFEEDFSGILSFYKEKQAPVFGLSDVKSMEEARKLGTAVLDENNRLVEFMEKAEEPKTTLASTAVYIFPAETRMHLDEYIANKNNPDAPGYFVAWLGKKIPVFGYTFKGKWFDIGSLESYELAKREWKA
ncbi:MAG: nucleotidyltransferase family protein [Candidatus Aenigmatarchaeota archaeon]|nr:nucleotidyltransferase family protein [Nanoarchaeota archaeon]